MEITALLTSYIYLLSSSLLLPVLSLLSVLSIWVVVYAGGFCAKSIHRYRLPKVVDFVSAFSNQDYRGGSQVVRSFVDALTARQQRDRSSLMVDNLLRETEQTLLKELDRLKIMVRVGPGLGLIGTLIPMGTGLAGLSQGDFSRLSGDLVIAFTTTVVGLALGLICYFFYVVQYRWFEVDMKNMELVVEIMTSKSSVDPVC